MLESYKRFASHHVLLSLVIFPHQLNRTINILHFLLEGLFLFFYFLQFFFYLILLVNCLETLFSIVDSNLFSYLIKRRISLSQIWLKTVHEVPSVFSRCPCRNNFYSLLYGLRLRPRLIFRQHILMFFFRANIMFLVMIF